MKKAFGLGVLLLGSLSAIAGVVANPLTDAVRSDDHAVIKRLLAAHVDPNAPQADKSTAPSGAGATQARG